MDHIPNLLTGFRAFAGLPLFLLVVWSAGTGGGGAGWAALILFLLAAVTDFLDGRIARRYGVQSPWGTRLDPVADKLLLTFALVALLAVDRIAGWHGLAVALILGRDLAVTGLRQFMATKDVALPVTGLAKMKTALQMTAAGWLLAGQALPMTAPSAIGVALLWAAAVITLWTGAAYLRAARQSTRTAPAVKSAAGPDGSASVPSGRVSAGPAFREPDPHRRPKEPA